MRQKVFAVCDQEEIYANRMAQLLLEKLKLPYELHLFTKTEELERFARQEEIAVLLIAERALQMLKEEIVKERVSQLFILQETEQAQTQGACCIDKYQSPEEVVRILLDSITDSSEWIRRTTQSMCDVKLIGVYSPVKRCLQTPFALTMGQILAAEHKVLYLNFECYSGLRQMLNREFATDMLDVMYYFRCAKEKLAVKLPAIVQKLNGMDYIPPVQSTLDLREVNGSQWGEFCREIAVIGEYEYLILDLDDSMNGLFDLLRQCFRIYTIAKDDRFAMAKMTQYEYMLKYYELEDITDNTVTCRFPFFERLPADIGMMTHGDLAKYVRAIIKEDLYGR